VHVEALPETREEEGKQHPGWALLGVLWKGGGEG